MNSVYSAAAHMRKFCSGNMNNEQTVQRRAVVHDRCPDTSVRKTIESMSHVRACSSMGNLRAGEKNRRYMQPKSYRFVIAVGISKTLLLFARGNRILCSRQAMTRECTRYNTLRVVLLRPRFFGRFHNLHCQNLRRSRRLMHVFLWICY